MHNGDFLKTAKDDWPFAIVRSYGSGDANKNFTEILLAEQDLHPGLIDEIWFSGAGALDPDALVRQVGIDENIRWREECRKRGIAFSYQQGVTLNHTSSGDVVPPGFPDDAWAVDVDRNRVNGLLCPTSPAAREANRRVAKLLMAELKPDSYWPDDDLRLTRHGNRICFCDRCIGLFNAEFGHSLSRKDLAAAIHGETPDATLRADWTEFNRRNLGRFASVYREVADEVHPSCRLGIQTIFSYEQYDGDDFRPMLEALSGPDHRPVGIRPGSGYYLDRTPRDMFSKGLHVLFEAARCKHYGFVRQICYESENWPHVSAEKNPGSQMLENALALAAGCDSLALYWGSDTNRESDDNFRFYFETFAKWKPFLLAIRDAFKGSVPAGVSEYRGENRLAAANWMMHGDEAELRLIENGLPLSCEYAAPQAFWLTASKVETLSEADLKKLFAKPVLTDVAAFAALAERFPKLDFIRKVKIASVAEIAPATSNIDCFEVFPGDCKARDVHGVITPCADDVVPFSAISSAADACGTCVVPTEFGGKVVLCQCLAPYFLWTGPRRTAILDALDSAIPFVKTAVRLLTGGYAVSVLAHVNRDGRTVGAFLVNAACGETPPLELAIRIPAFYRWQIRTPEATFPAEILSADANEVRLRLPPMKAWTPLLVEGVKETERERPRPSRQLLKRIAVDDIDAIGLVHFSVNTFTDREWGYGNESESVFNPTAFDPDRIAAACAAADLKGVIIVAKHHDGFCLWDTKTTPHNVMRSPFGRDYVREFADALRRHGLKVGLYVSPWDRNCAFYGTPEYRELYRRQVMELFGGAYGDLFEIWFDGANGGDGWYGGACERRTISLDYYRYAELIEEVRRAQPDICVMGGLDAGDFHYPGNEEGRLSPDARCTCRSVSENPEGGCDGVNLYSGDFDGGRFQQPECDFPMRRGWFYHASADGQTKSAEHIMRRYLETVGNGGCMNLGIVPDKRGSLTDEDIGVLEEFGKLKRAFFANKVKSGLCNMVVLREDIADGEHVDGWELHANGLVLAEGSSIGVKRIRVLPRPVPVDSLELVVTAARGDFRLKPAEHYLVADDLLKRVLPL